MNIDLSKLAEPFPPDDIEWRVARAGSGNKGIWCKVLAYITARAIQQRLDDVCGPENWRLEEPHVVELGKTTAFACGLSINIAEPGSPPHWITKWDVAEPTHVEPAKGGWSSAVKRAGAVWNVGRYLYHLESKDAKVTDVRPAFGVKGWHRAKLDQTVYWWKPPSLPGWALPKEPEHEISRLELETLYRAWRDKFAPDTKNPSELTEAFSRFVTSICGDFPASDYTCWTRDALERCEKKIADTTDPGGVSPDVPFEE